MILSRKERGRYMREIQRSMKAILLPELKSSRALDFVQQIIKTLSHFIIEQEFWPEIRKEIKNRFKTTLADIAGLLEKSGVAPDLSDKIRRTISETPGKEASEEIKELWDLAQKTVAQLYQLERENIPGLNSKVFELISIENDLHDRITELRDEISDQPVSEGAETPVQGSTTTPEKLTTYLRKRYPEHPEIRVKGLTVVPGGRSKETTIVELENGGDLPKELVLRKDQAISIVESKAADEYAVLDVVYRLGGVPIPRPILFERDESILGGTFLLMEKASGTRQGEFFPEYLCTVEDKKAIGTQLAQILGRLHSMDVGEFKGSHLDTKADMKKALLERIEEKYRLNTVQMEMPPNPSVEYAYHWLLENVEIALTGDMCLLQGDLGLHNMLIDENRITALLDWELVRIGLPASELGDTIHLIEFLMPLEEFVEIYQNNGGSASACDPKALTYYAVLQAMHAATISGLAGYYFRSGAVNDFTLADAGYDFYLRGCKLLSQALRKIDSI